MNKTELLLSEITSLAFATNVTVVSGFVMLSRALSENKTLRDLIDHIGNHIDRIELVRRTAYLLLDKRIDPIYEHPDDPALTCLLYVLWIADNGSGCDLDTLPIDIVTSGKKGNLFWSRRLALHISGLTP